MRTPNFLSKSRSGALKARIAVSIVALSTLGAVLTVASSSFHEAMAADASQPAAAAPDQRADISDLQDRVGSVLSAIGSLKMRDRGEQPTLEDRLNELASEVAQLRGEAVSLRSAQSDTTTELSHIRAGLANAEIGLDSLRASVDGHEASRHDAEAGFDTELNRLKAQTASLQASQGSIEDQLPSMRANIDNNEIGLVSLRATVDQFSKADSQTGSIGGAAATDHILSNWSVQKGRGRRAVITSDRNTYRVKRVAPLFGLVTGVRHGNRRVVVTEKGTIIQR